jgi:hypothetical protein
LRFIKHRFDKTSPFPKCGFYWLIFLLMVLVGGGCAVLLQATDLKAAVAFGFSAPELLTKVLSKTPSGSGSDEGGDATAMFTGEASFATWFWPRLRAWWSL